MNIILYSTGCPQCRVLETKLKQANILFKIVTDEKEVLKVGEEHQISSMPILSINDKYLDFSSAINFLNKLKD